MYIGQTSDWEYCDALTKSIIYTTRNHSLQFDIFNERKQHIDENGVCLHKGLKWRREKTKSIYFANNLYIYNLNLALAHTK